MEQVYAVFSCEDNYLSREEDCLSYSHRAAFEHMRDLHVIGYMPVLQAFASRRAFYEWKEQNNVGSAGTETGEAAQGGDEKAAV